MANSVDMDIKLRILNAARKLFAVHGYNGTSIRQICEEAGANIALVSYHFGGKENMFEAMIATFFPEDKVKDADVNLDPLTGVRRVIREVTVFRLDNPELVRIIQQEIVMETSRMKTIAKYFMPVWAMLRNWLEQGGKQDIFRFRSLDTTLMSIIGTLLFYRDNLYWQEIAGEKTMDREALIADLTDFILNGLLVREAEREGGSE